MNSFRTAHICLSTVMMSLILSFVAVAPAAGAPAIDVLGKDFTFPNAIGGLPAKLSEFPGRRYAMDVREFTQHLKLESAAYCGSER